MGSLHRLQTLDLGDNHVADLSPLADAQDLAVLKFSLNSVVSLSPLAGNTSLVTLIGNHNTITDLQPLAACTALDQIELESNLIKDITPLVDNPGIGAGDEVRLERDGFPCEDQKANIEALLARGVNFWPTCDHWSWRPDQA